VEVGVVRAGEYRVAVEKLAGRRIVPGDELVGVVEEVPTVVLVTAVS